MSSTAAVFPLPYFQVYSSSKHYLEAFHHGLTIEYPDFVYLLVRPHFVSTKMVYGKESFDSVNAKQHVSGVLREFGRLPLTYGHWKHMLIGYLAELCPRTILNLITKNVGLEWIDDHEKARKEGISLD